MEADYAGMSMSQSFGVQTVDSKCGRVNYLLQGPSAKSFARRQSLSKTKVPAGTESAGFIRSNYVTWTSNVALVSGVFGQCIHMTSCAGIGDFACPLSQHMFQSSKLKI